MAQAPNAGISVSATDAQQNKNYLVPLIILASLFFMWGFLTSLNDILIPYFKKLFELNYTQALMIQFCFFAAYGVCSIPSGTLVKRIGYQRGAVIGLTIAAVGCFLFVPAANQLSYNLFLGALFVLASGITLLQVSANPYVAQLGPAPTAPRRLTLTQAFNSLGAFLGPIVGATLLLGAAAAQFEMSAEAVKAPYIKLAVALLVMATIFLFIKLPKLAGHSEAGSYGDSLKYRHLVLGVIAIFVYVGAEVSIGSLIISFMAEPSIAGVPAEQAAKFVAYYWGLALIGRFVGVALMFVIPGNRMLLINASCAVGLLVVTITTTGQSAYIALVAVGFFNSLMFPTIFSLAISRLGHLASRGSGLLCTAIIGGALIPVTQGMVADTSGLQISFIIPAFCYLYIAFYGAKGWQPKGPSIE